MAQQVQGLFPGPGDQSHNEANLLSKYVQAKPSTSDRSATITYSTATSWPANIACTTVTP